MVPRNRCLVGVVGIVGGDGDGVGDGVAVAAVVHEPIFDPPLEHPHWAPNCWRYGTSVSKGMRDQWSND